MFTIPDFKASKEARRRVAMLTCYDASQSAVLERTQVDAVLVGDSVAMVVHGFPNTTHATIEMMLAHTRAVRAGSATLCVVADMPFGSTRRGTARGVDAAASLVRAGANAVKIEGLAGHERLIPALVGGGVPVMGHLGLQPQSVNSLGGHLRQGKTEAEAARIAREAVELERLGCFAIVLECVPDSLAREITGRLGIPTIGIGSGPSCDGQILVFHDAVGLTPGKMPPFAASWADGKAVLRAACDCFADEARRGAFPAPTGGTGSCRAS